MGITEISWIYLWGEFEVHTDNNPLTYILTSAKLDVTRQRWVAGLANYNIKISYKCGKQNIEADALSQINWVEQQVIVVKACLMSGVGDYEQFPNLPPETILQNSVVESSPGIPESEWRE